RAAAALLVRHRPAWCHEHTSHAAVLSDAFGYAGEGSVTNGPREVGPRARRRGGLILGARSRLSLSGMSGPIAGESMTVHVELAIAGKRARYDLALPRGPTRPVRMLPVIREVAEGVLGRAIADVEARGEAISCKPGCTWCCEQLIPISETEAR